MENIIHLRDNDDVSDDTNPSTLLKLLGKDRGTDGKPAIKKDRRTDSQG